MRVVGTSESANKSELARRLWRLADLVQAAESRRSFRAKAYRRAVWALDDLPALDVPDERLLATPGIGPGVTSLIREFRETGELNQLTPLETAYPVDVARMRRLPRMSARMLRDLKTGLGVETISDLQAAIDSGAAETVRGAGPQTLDLWGRILALPPDPGSVPAHQAWVMAHSLAAHLAEHTARDVEVAGGVRRVDEWIERLDLVVVSDQPDPVVSFLRETAVLHDLEEISTGIHTAVTLSGLPVVFHVAPPEASGTALLVATGPEEHVNVVLGSGPFPSERKAYESAGLPWMPPGARGLGVEAASEVVTTDDIKGDLHIHTDASPDGRMSLRTVVTEAQARGYEYVLITDHTLGLRFGGLGGRDIAKQHREIEQLRGETPHFVIFHGAELNIDRDGTLDLDEESLDILDFAVAGVHSHFGLDPKTQTLRVLRALEHPKVRILAHPFGRRIGMRPPLDIDMELVISSAQDHGVALETNGHRDRLDLPAEWVSTAAQSGTDFAANSDAHRRGELENVAVAVATLQRGGVTAAQVVNTYSLAELTAWISDPSSRVRPNPRLPTQSAQPSL